MHLNVRKLARNEQMDKRFVHENILAPGGCLPLPWGYIHVYDKTIQTSGNGLANQSQTLCGGKLGRGMKFCINSEGHITKMGTMAINNKHL